MRSSSVRPASRTFNQGFFVGYSPERINPGDRAHRVTGILRSLPVRRPKPRDFVDALYASIIAAGTTRRRASEGGRGGQVIKEQPRDLNIALVNDLAILFHRLGIDTLDVPEAAGTKWNFPACPASSEGTASASIRITHAQSAQQVGTTRGHPSPAAAPTTVRAQYVADQAHA